MSDELELKRKKYKILQITAQPFPPEIRVVKEGRSFHKAGYQSAVLCPPILDRPSEENWDGIQVFRPPVLNKLSRFSEKLLFQSSFFSWPWYQALREVIEKYKPDILHVHDIWLGRTVFWAAKGIKVTLDLHENMPAAVVEYQKGYRGPLKWHSVLFNSFYRMKRYEQALLLKSAGVFVVVDEAAKRVSEAYPRLSKQHIVTVENLESKRFLENQEHAEQLIEKDHFSILYIGGFGPHRGIETLVRAMVYIRDFGLNVRVHLVGARGGQYLTMIEALVRELGVEKYVHIRGWVLSHEVLTYIRQADVGCVPHHSNPHTNATIPHKLYQYMMAGTPILVSSSPPLARTVRQARCGEIFEAGNAQDCADKIKNMYQNRQLLNDYVAHGLSYTLEQGYNWEEISAHRLVSFYDELLQC